MKNGINFKLNIWELIIILASVFLSGCTINSDVENKYNIGAMLILGSAILILKKRDRVRKQ